MQAITGAQDEFISGARLDNLVGTYTAIGGLLESLAGECDANAPGFETSADYWII